MPDFILDKMKLYINTWKKQYAEEAQRSSTANKNKNHNNVNVSHNSTLMSPSTTNSNSSSMNLPPLNPPPPPLPIHIQTLQQQQIPHQQISNPLSQQQNVNSYQMNRNSPAGVMYDSNLLSLPSGPQPHDISDMRDYIHMDKNPPMYPGHSTQQQIPQMPSASSGGYSHTQPLDPIEQAISKGDWSNVSDRSLLQYALQVRFLQISYLER